MTVSVLIPYYNDRDYLGQAIESVLNQTYQDFELILVNHATTDDCREIAHSYQDPRIKHIDMDQNYGAGTGLIVIEFLKQAKGKYIKLFCADDVMYPNCLEDMANYMESHPQIDFAFGDVEHIDEKNKSLKKSWFTSRYKFSLENNETDCLYEYFNGYSILPYIGSFIKRDALNSIDIDKSFIMVFDMSLWVKLLIKGYKIGYYTKYIAGYRIHGNQMSSSKKQDLVFRRCKFEFCTYMKAFFQISDTNKLRKMFNNNKWIQTITDLTLEDLQFIMAFEMLTNTNETIRDIGYNYIYECLHNDTTRKYLEKKFNFGIQDFRAIYSRGFNYDFSIAQNLKLSQITYIFFKKLIFKLTLKEYFDKKRLKAL